MSDEKVYTPDTISDNPLPGQVEGAEYGSSQSTSGDELSQNKITENRFPSKKIAVELIGSALNTKSKKILAEFEFTDMGAISIGKYVPGVSGDIRQTPNGIVARDSAGVTTFALDGTTGSAVFSGTIQAGSIISGRVVVGNNSWVIDGDSGQPSMSLYFENVPTIFIGIL